MNITIKQIPYDSVAYKDIWQLREDILRKPIGLSLNDEDLSAERDEIILAAYDGDMLAGCLVLQPKDSTTVKLRQMAVAKGMQGKGIGTTLMQEAESLAGQLGHGYIVLHARMTAKEFYEQLGYTATGDVFTEVGIPHIAMEKHTS